MIRLDRFKTEWEDQLRDDLSDWIVNEIRVNNPAPTRLGYVETSGRAEEAVRELAKKSAKESIRTEIKKPAEKLKINTATKPAEKAVKAEDAKPLANKADETGYTEKKMTKEELDNAAKTFAEEFKKKYIGKGKAVSMSDVMKIAAVAFKTGFMFSEAKKKNSSYFDI